MTRFDAVQPGLGGIIMKEYDLMSHPLRGGSWEYLVRKLDGLVPGLGPLVAEFDGIPHVEHGNPDERRIIELTEKFNEVTGTAYSTRQKDILRKAPDSPAREALRFTMDCAIDLYNDHLKNIRAEVLHIYMSEVEDILHSRLYMQPSRGSRSYISLHIFDSIMRQEHREQD